MQGVLAFLAIQRQVLHTAAKEQRAVRIVVEDVPGFQRGLLQTGAIGEIGGRQQPDGMLKIAGQRLLLEVIGMDRRQALVRRSLLVEGCVVIIDTRQDLRGHPEHHILDA